MEQDWMIHRQIVEQAEAQRRWDLVYQCLLKWSKEKSIDSKPEEADHESGDLCTGVNTASGTNSND
jgi:hypothetical protein